MMRIREAAQMTQKEWSELLGVTISTVSNWERGLQVPRLTFLQTKKMIEASGLTIDDLLKDFERTQKEKKEADRLRGDNRRRPDRRVKKSP